MGARLKPANLSWPPPLSSHLSANQPQFSASCRDKAAPWRRYHFQSHATGMCTCTTARWHFSSKRWRGDMLDGDKVTWESWQEAEGALGRFLRYLRAGISLPRIKPRQAAECGSLSQLPLFFLSSGHYLEPGHLNTACCPRGSGALHYFQEPCTVQTGETVCTSAKCQWLTKILIGSSSLTSIKNRLPSCHMSPYQNINNPSISTTLTQQVRWSIELEASRRVCDEIMNVLKWLTHSGLF